MKQKNNKYDVILLFICCLSLFSCGYSTKEDKAFPEEKELVFNDMNVNEKTDGVISIKSAGSFLVVTGRNMETQILLIDKKTKASYMFGETGEGPGRFLQAANIMPTDNKHIGIYDLQKRLIYNFNIDSIIRGDKRYMPDILMKQISSFSPIQIDRLNENKFAAISIGGTGLNRFILVDGEGEIISKEGELPEKKSEEISDETHAFAYWGRITTNPKKNKVATCTNYAGMMQIYDCSTDKAALIKEHNLFLADYNERSGNFIVTPQTRWGYLSIDSNDTYIFALYSGLNQVENPDGSFTKSHILHVFDWNGNPLIRLIGDRQLSHICVDENALYGYDANRSKSLLHRRYSGCRYRGY
ncbi:MAG: TolB-like 6-bladed beta-propeller domain-containing protein [Tannerellaceae bacterium]|jgi:hypothetical protein|nr:TolB-like 6-bladed beta-propeller domain-containing protein [Tannerellaceae bacterium]